MLIWSLASWLFRTPHFLQWCASKPNKNSSSERLADIHKPQGCPRILRFGGLLPGVYQRVRQLSSTSNKIAFQKWLPLDQRGCCGFWKFEESVGVSSSTATTWLYTTLCDGEWRMWCRNWSYTYSTWPTIAFYSEALKGSALALSNYEKEMLAIIKAIYKWHPYLLGKPFIVRTDQPSLKFLMEQRITTLAQTWWLPKIMGYNYTIQYKKGKENQGADALSRVTEAEC